MTKTKTKAGQAAAHEFIDQFTRRAPVDLTSLLTSTVRHEPDWDAVALAAITAAYPTTDDERQHCEQVIAELDDVKAVECYEKSDWVALLMSERAVLREELRQARLELGWYDPETRARVRAQAELEE